MLAQQPGPAPIFKQPLPSFSLTQLCSPPKILATAPPPTTQSLASSRRDGKEDDGGGAHALLDDVAARCLSLGLAAVPLRRRILRELELQSMAEQRHVAVACSFGPCASLSLVTKASSSTALSVIKEEPFDGVNAGIAGGLRGHTYEVIVRLVR